MVTIVFCCLQSSCMARTDGFNKGFSAFNDHELNNLSLLNLEFSLLELWHALNVVSTLYLMTNLPPLYFFDNMAKESFLHAYQFQQSLDLLSAGSNWFMQGLFSSSILLTFVFPTSFSSLDFKSIANVKCSFPSIKSHLIRFYRPLSLLPPLNCLKDHRL